MWSLGGGHEGGEVGSGSGGGGGSRQGRAPIPWRPGPRITNYNRSEQQQRCNMLRGVSFAFQHQGTPPQPRSPVGPHIVARRPQGGPLAVLKPLERAWPPCLLRCAQRQGCPASAGDADRMHSLPGIRRLPPVAMPGQSFPCSRRLPKTACKHIAGSSLLGCQPVSIARDRVYPLLQSCQGRRRQLGTLQPP